MTAFPLCLKGPENTALYNNLSDGLVEWNAAKGIRSRRFKYQSQVRMYSVGVSVVGVSVCRVSERIRVCRVGMCLCVCRVSETVCWGG